MQVLISLRRKKTYVEVVLVEFNIVVVIDQETRVHRIIDDIIVIFKFLKAKLKNYSYLSRSRRVLALLGREKGRKILKTVSSLL